MDEVTRLSQGQYLSLTTFRLSGDAVATPVWIARDGEHLYVTTKSDSGKVKRLRNNGDVLLAPCDVRGNVTGPEVPGTARLLDDAGTERVRSLIRKRYGLMAKALMIGEKVRRGSASIGIEITPAGTTSGTPDPTPGT